MLHPNVGMMTLSLAGPAVLTAFLASLVEAVDGVTVVLAVATVRGWRSAGTGALAGLVILALLILTLGSLVEHVPLPSLQFVTGVVLLSLGMRWLRKAVLRAVHVIPLRDEQILFERQSALLADFAHRQARLDRLATLASFKAVLLEGLGVVFIVMAVGAGHGLLGAASLAAMAACGLIIALGWVASRPLARVPENALKFAVGTLLSTIGVFWIGKGLGVPWPRSAFAVPGIAVLFLSVALATIQVVRRPGMGLRP